MKPLFVHAWFPVRAVIVTSKEEILIKHFYFKYLHIHVYIYIIQNGCTCTCIHIYICTCTYYNMFPGLCSTTELFLAFSYKNVTKPQNPFHLLMSTTLFYCSGENPDIIYMFNVHTCMCHLVDSGCFQWQHGQNLGCGTHGRKIWWEYAVMWSFLTSCDNHVNCTCSAGRSWGHSAKLLLAWRWQLAGQHLQSTYKGYLLIILRSIKVAKLSTHNHYCAW